MSKILEKIGAKLTDSDFKLKLAEYLSTLSVSTTVGSLYKLYTYASESGSPIEGSLKEMFEEHDRLYHLRNGQRGDSNYLYVVQVGQDRHFRLGLTDDADEREFMLRVVTPSYHTKYISVRDGKSAYEEVQQLLSLHKLYNNYYALPYDLGVAQCRIVAHNQRVKDDVDTESDEETDEDVFRKLQRYRDMGAPKQKVEKYRWKAMQLLQNKGTNVTANKLEYQKGNVRATLTINEYNRVDVKSLPKDIRDKYSKKVTSKVVKVDIL